MGIKKLFEEFCSTFTEVHYFIGGLLLGIILGMWLGLAYVMVCYTFFA